VLRMQEARGSSPLISTTDFGHFGGLFFGLMSSVCNYYARNSLERIVVNHLSNFSKFP
jgi:hypothetical protein